MADHLKTSSLRRRLTALRKAQELSKYPSPTKDEKVKMVVRGILRTKGEAQKHASPTLLKDIQKMMEAIPDSTKGIRDKALLLLGLKLKSSPAKFEIEKLASIRTKGFSGHSLRAGFATVAAINGASEREIQKTTGHMNLEVFRRYIRDGEMFRENASKKLGL